MSQIYSTIKKSIKSRGITLVETIFYIFVLVVITSIIVQMLVGIGGMYRNIKITRELESSGTIAMESMLREIRNASTVVTAGSTFEQNPGTLKISGFDESSNPYNVTFNTSSGLIQISRNGDPFVPITSSSGSVSYLVFTHLVGPNSEGVRIELEMSGTFGAVSKSERFYGFAILRGSY